MRVTKDIRKKMHGPLLKPIPEFIFATAHSASSVTLHCQLIEVTLTIAHDSQHGIVTLARVLHEHVVSPKR